MASTVKIKGEHRLALRIPEVEMLAQAMYMIRTAVNAGNLDKDFWIGDRSEVARWSTLQKKLEIFYEDYEHQVDIRHIKNA